MGALFSACSGKAHWTIVCAFLICICPDVGLLKKYDTKGANQD